MAHLRNRDTVHHLLGEPGLWQTGVVMNSVFLRDSSINPVTSLGENLASVNTRLYGNINSRSLGDFLKVRTQIAVPKVTIGSRGEGE